MADTTSEAIVDALVRDLGASPDEPTLLARLDDASMVLVESDLVHRLLPFARRFRTVDFSAHPWAGLVAGVALCAIDRQLGRATLRAARERFEARGDATGEGYGCFLEGLEDIGEGHIDSATERWSRSRELLGGEGPVEGMALAHLALGAYAEGNLALAHLMATQSLATARLQGDDRLVGIACMYLGFIDVHTGEFGHADAIVAEGLAALGRLEPDNRYEWPMLRAIEGCLASLRGDDPAAERAWDDAIVCCDRTDNRWYEAIARVVRADCTARLDPGRAVDDARQALDYFSWADEGWWVHWARTALVTAHRWSGDLATAAELARRLLRAALTPLERGRALVAQGEALLALDQPDALDVLDRAVATLDGVDAKYWAARADLLTAVVDARRSEVVTRRMRLRAGVEATDPAWVRLLDPAATLRDTAPVARRRASTTTGEIVLDLVARGFTSRQAAAALLVSPNTIETHVRAAMRVTGASTRAQAAALLLELPEAEPADGADLRDDERAILELLVAGRTIAQVGQELHFSRRTVERRLAELRERTGLTTNQALVGRARELGLHRPGGVGVTGAETAAKRSQRAPLAGDL